MNAKETSYGSAHTHRGWIRWAIGGIFVLLLLGIFVVPLVYFGWFAVHVTYPFLPRPYFLFFPFGVLLFFVLIFVGFRFLFWGWGWGRWRRGYYGGYGYYGGSSIEILDQRYARGEITKDQYEQMKRDISQRPD